MSEDCEDSWDDYDSQFLFPSADSPCTCEHDATDHDYSACTVNGCPCEAYWEHT